MNQELIIMQRIKWKKVLICECTCKTYVIITSRPKESKSF